MMQSSDKQLGRRTNEMKKETMGMIDKAVSKWERDLSYPDVNSLPKLAEVFEMSVDELMQIKTGTAQQVNKMPVSEIIPLILRAVCLAMGVAVVALSAIGKLDTNSAITMLGIGLACGGISLLDIKSKLIR